MLRASFIICVICTTAVYGWHLTEQSSDARTLDSSQSMTSRDKPDMQKLTGNSIEEPTHSEAKLSEIKQEPAEKSKEEIEELTEPNPRAHANPTAAAVHESDHPHTSEATEASDLPDPTPTSNTHAKTTSQANVHEENIDDTSVGTHNAEENAHSADNDADPRHSDEHSNVADEKTPPSILPGDNVTTTRDSNDVDPLDIFVDDIKFQRFPPAMDYTTFIEKIEGNKFKKLYILEETDKKLFENVRQLRAKYKIKDDNVLTVNYEYRFIYSRACQEIKKFRLGTHVGNTNKAYFEKDLGDGVIERILFFSESPDDYVFFMSCTDRKTSPYACRDKFYVSLDSAHDPPNQFPWLLAAEELKMKMDLSFQDPRFIFNFVMMPCD